MEKLFKICFWMVGSMSFVALGRDRIPIIIFESEIALNFLRLGSNSLKLEGSLVGGVDTDNTAASAEAVLGDLEVPGDCSTPNFLQSALTFFTCFAVSFFYFFDFVFVVDIGLILPGEDIMEGANNNAVCSVVRCFGSNKGSRDVGVSYTCS